MITPSRLSTEAIYFVEVPDFGEVGAGTVVPFVGKEEFTTVLVPVGLARPDQVGTVTVRGSSLVDEGIVDGDRLVFRTNIESCEVTQDSICLVRIIATDELLAKRVVRLGPPGGKIALRSSNRDYPDRVFEPDEIEVVGIVFAMQRCADRFGRFGRSDCTGSMCSSG